MAGMNPAVHAASRDLTPQMGRAMVYAWVSLAFTIGALMSTMVAAQTLPIWPGWRSQYWIAAGLGTFTALVIFIFYRDLSRRVRGEVQQTLQQSLKLTSTTAIEPPDEIDAYDYGRLVYRSPRLWLLSLVIVFWSLTYVTVSAYVPTFLIQHYHLEPARAASVTSYFWVVFTSSVFISGWLSDRLRVRKTVIAFGGLTTGGCFIIGANLPVDTPETTLMLMWSVTGFFCRFHLSCLVCHVFRNREAISPPRCGSRIRYNRDSCPLSGSVFEPRLTPSSRYMGLVDLDGDRWRMLLLRDCSGRSWTGAMAT
jgi:MFS family permease